MQGREWLIFLLFALFFIGAVVYIFAMLERKRSGQSLERDRLIFFFVACLLLICLVPVWLAKLLKMPVLVANLCAAGANGVGFVLTYRRSARAEGEAGPERNPMRTFQVYYQGQPYGIVTREGFERLLECELLKKQRTVELIDNYQQQARQQGVTVQLLKNEDGSLTLIKVEGPGE